MLTKPSSILLNTHSSAHGTYPVPPERPVAPKRPIIESRDFGGLHTTGRPHSDAAPRPQEATSTSVTSRPTVPLFVPSLTLDDGLDNHSTSNENPRNSDGIPGVVRGDGGI